MDILKIEEHVPEAFGTSLADSVEKFLLELGTPLSWLIYVKLLVYILIAIVVVIFLQLTVRAILSFIIKKVHSTSKKNILDYLIDNNLPHYLALLAPYTFIRNVVPVIFSDFPSHIGFWIKLTDISLVFLTISSLIAIVKSLINLMQERPAFAHKPMKSYVQIISIIFYGIGSIVIFAIITEQSPGVIFAGLGAASAVTMLVFQDSIKGFIGSIQMTTNNMVELGDWIEMKNHGADGNVEEINLTTVKVRNWDNTITTIPTYSLISESFQNWKPMELAGARRFKRAILMKQGSIRFMRRDELSKFSAMKFYEKVIEDRQEKNKNIDEKFINNMVPVTNNDLYMAYAEHYLKNHPDINEEMTITFRQLEPTASGLPLEIYAFTRETGMVAHNRVASEIINHLIGMVDYFDLKLFELQSDTAGSADNKSI